MSKSYRIVKADKYINATIEYWTGNEWFINPVHAGLWDHADDACDIADRLGHKYLDAYGIYIERVTL